ncbi:MAG: hypothetical protein H0W61_10880 [Bacteroidetes bacterium]|nr:hypothetical protein [Bacteroidota bacterium]
MIRSFLFSFSICLALKIASQSLANYSVVRNTGIVYSSINSSGTAFGNWRNTTVSTNDDNRTDFTNIGFDFWYNGIRYTQFSASVNGFIDFSSSTDDGGPVADDFGPDNTAFTNSVTANGTRLAIAPFYDDLIAQAGTASLGNSIKYYLSGAAPSRTLTVEWMNMSVYLNPTPNLNFQVQIVETSGQIIINYGTMNAGSQNFSYSMGMNGSSMSATPTAAELKTLQSANGTSFSNAVQNGLSVIPTTASQYVFSPPVPTTASGSLIFSAVSQTAITLSWTNWASNETGYVIYNSTDGVNYTFAAQTAVNATSSIITSLLPATTYYWKVYAVTEGWLSSAITGIQATTSAGNKISTGSGNWSNNNSWSPSGVPGAGDNVTIANGHTLQINTTVLCNNLTIGQGVSGGLQFNNGGGNYSVTINNNLTINAGGSFFVPGNANGNSKVTLKGNAVNNGTLDLAANGGNSFAKLIFSRNGSQSLAGTGPVTNFNEINVSLGSSTNTLDISIPSFSATANFLNLTTGIFKLTSSNAATVIPFTASTTINSNSGFYLNSPSLTFSVPSSVTLNGTIAIGAGKLRIGDALDEDLILSGGSINMVGGTIDVAGKVYGTGVNNICNVSISGGTLTVPSFTSSNTSIAPFNLTGAGSVFNMSGGVIIIPREGGTGLQDLGYINTLTNGSVTGGTLQIGNTSTPASQTININSTMHVGNLAVASASAIAKLITNSLVVIGNVTNTGTLIANNLSMQVGGNWINTASSFSPGTAQVKFSSNAAQTISRTGGETFNNLLFAGTGIKTFSSAIIASGNFSINAGALVDVSASNNQLTIKGNYINNGSFNSRAGLVWFNGVTAQTIGGSSVTNFWDMTLGNAAGATLTGAENLLGTLTLTTGVLKTNSQVFTMVSTATATARIAQITGSGDIIGNVTVQRFAPGGTTGWALFGTPISSALTLNDWDDNIAISCPTCPDGSAAGFLSIYTYDETVNGLYDNYLSYIPLSTINDPILPTKGYWVYLGNGQFSTTGITIDVTGTVRKFNYTIPLNYTNYGSAVDDGWNLIQNPYPSPISWSALKGATANVDNAIYVYNADLNGGAGGFATYINGVSSPAVGSGGVGNSIPMSQAFYVHSTGSTGLNVTEAIKVAGNPTYLKTNNSSNNSAANVRINLQNASGFNDETVLYIQPGASDFFDVDFDAYKMRGQDPYAPSVALEKVNKVFQVNGVAPISGNFSMPLKTLTGYAGTYTLSAGNFSSFPYGACINLYDKFTNITTDLKTSNYIFYLSDTTTVARFDLNITVNPLNINAAITQPVCQNLNAGKIVATGASSGPWNYFWTSNGTSVKTSLNKTTADTLDNLSSGNFDLEMNTVGMCDNGNTSYVVNPQFVSNAQFVSDDTLDLIQSASIAFYNLSSYAVSYAWDFGDGSASSAVASPIHYYALPGNYTVQLISWSSTGCSDTATKVIVVIINDVGTTSNGITASDLVLKSLGDNEFVFERAFNEERSLSFQLTDTWGRLITDYGTVTSKLISLPVDLNRLAPGIYLMNITSGAQRKVVKLPVK